MELIYYPSNLQKEEYYLLYKLVNILVLPQSHIMAKDIVDDVVNLLS